MGHLKLFIVSILILLFLLLHRTTSQDNCIFPTNDVYYAYNQTMACFYSVAYSANVASSTLNTIQSLYPSYIYKDIVRNSTMSGSLFSLTTTVEENLEALKNIQFTRDYDFHANITAIFQSVKDANMRYRKPTCYAQFSFVQPFSLTSAVRQINNTQQQFLYVYQADPTAGYFHNLLYQTNISDFSVFQKMKVVTINGVDAMTYMLQNCAATSWRSKDIQVAFNYCLIRDWHIRQLIMHNAPTAMSIDYVLQNETTGQNFNITVNWLTSLMNPTTSSTDFAQQCLQQSDGIAALMNQLNYNPGPQFTDYLPNTLLQTPDFAMSTWNNDYAILRLFTFLPTQGNTANEIMSTFEALKPRGQVSNLIIDLRSGLQGGDDCFAYSLAQYLVPSIPYVPNFSIDMMQSQLLNSLYSCPATSNNNDLCTVYSSQNMSYLENTRNWFLEGISHTRGGRTSFYSQLVHRQCTDGYSCEYYFFRRCPYRWLPQNFMILTDGTCEGSCAVFVRMLQQLRKAVVVTVGGLISSSSKMQPVSTVSSRGTTYMTLISYLQASASTCPIAVPSAFPTTADLVIMLEEPYGYTPELSAYEEFRTSTDLPLEYTSVEADFQAMNWDFANYDSIYSSAVPFFQTCTPWEVQENGCSYSGSLIPNGIYGSPCDATSGVFDTQTCILYTCSDGFYLLNETCLAVPQPDRTIGARIALKIGMGVLGSLIGIVLFVVVPIAIAIAVVVKKRNLI